MLEDRSWGKRGGLPVMSSGSNNNPRFFNENFKNDNNMDFATALSLSACFFQALPQALGKILSYMKVENTVSS